MYFGMEVKITPIFTDDEKLTGINVRVGCQRFFYTGLESMLMELRNYLYNPRLIQQVEGFARNIDMIPQQPIAPPTGIGRGVQPAPTIPSTHTLTGTEAENPI